MQDRHLLLINIGPVQGFIAAARRTRDLYAGSRLLSEIAHRVAEKLLKRTGEKVKVTLIFPSADDKRDLDRLAESGIPNVILAEVLGLEAQGVAELAQEAEKAARAFLAEKVGAILKERAVQNVLNPDIKPFDLEKAALSQVKDLLEFYYVVLPFGGRRYKQVRDIAGRAMAARKNTRDFGPNPWPAPVFKSSLDGSLESLTAPRRKKLREKLRVGIREGEHLSGVDLLKRFYHLTDRGVRFASTSDVALLPFLAGLTEEEEKRLRGVLEDIKSTLTAGDKDFSPRLPEHLVENFPLLGEYDARLFFPERHRELFEEGLGGDDEARPWEETRRKLADLYNAMKKSPYPYYAILHADGDHMGKAIDAQESIVSHRELSAQLTKFAERVGDIVKKHQGSLVYSGGDDVLALLPLHTVLDCARELAEEFKQQLCRFKSAEGKSPTLSVGVAVVHHLFDLGEALDFARAAEKVAKKRRNSLAVTFAPRSGVSATAHGEWDECWSLDERLKKLACFLEKDLIPHGFAYELKKLSEELEGLEDEGLKKEILHLEAERILWRKEKFAERARDELLLWLDSYGPEEVAREIIVARAFAKAFDLAKACPGKEVSS